MSQKRRFLKCLIIHNKIAQLLRSVTHCYGNCYETSVGVTSVTYPLRDVTVTTCAVTLSKRGFK